MEEKEESGMMDRIEKILQRGPDHNADERNTEKIISDLSVYYQELVFQNEEMKRIMHENEMLKERYQRLYEDAPAGYVVYDNSGQILAANNTLCCLLGFPLQDCRKYRFTRYVLPEFQDELYLMVQKVIKTGGPESIEIQIRSGNENRDVMVTTNCYREEGGLSGSREMEGRHLLRSVITDITELKRRQRDFWNRSVHDPLTGIYNRQFFKDEMHCMDVPENLPLSVAMADIDGLKIINDTLGHEFGDQAIKRVVEELQRHTRPECVMMRIGGDEIVILFPRTELETARRYMQDAKKAVGELSVSGIPLSFSWGIATKNTSEERFSFVMAAAEDIMYSRKQVRGRRCNGAVQMILESLFERNRQVRDHSMRIRQFVREFGVWMGLEGRELECLCSAALLHDIGMVSISDEILNKNEPLTEAEQKEILRHPEVGGRILYANGDTADYAKAVLCHHENWDGSGYPKGLRGQEIPFEARILAIADAYDRMKYGLNGKGTRYKTEALALEEFKRCAGRQFDPDMTEKLLKWRQEKRMIDP